MRPQIRSLPLCKVECPQFSWAVRNNSENISVALQPDLHNYQEKNEEENNIFVEENQGNGLAPNKSCYCLDQRLRPTLFPHPVSCVCSNEPYPPTNEKYRYCRLKMDKAIGDVMEEIIMENIPISPSFPAPRTDRLMKKIMRSSYIPEQVDLTDKNACVECLAKDPIMLKELVDSIKYKKNLEDEREDRNICMDAEECRKRSIAKDEFKYFGDSSPPEPEVSQDKRCKWKKDTVCSCKELRNYLCRDCDKCGCKCRKTCLKCTCKKGEVSKLIDSPSRKEESCERSVHIEHPTEDKDEGDLVKTKKSSKKVSKGKESVETGREPLLSSPHVRKLEGKTKKTQVKSPKKSRAKSPVKKTKLKRPDNIICERFEFIETNPFFQENESGVNQMKKVSPVQIYEHYRAVGAVKSGSSKSASEQVVIPSLTRPKSFNTRKFITSSLSSTKNPRKTRVNHNNKPVKMPWNWHNQPKVEDPYKDWGGTRYSWSKKLDYAALGRNLEENNEKLLRSRGGDDAMVGSGVKGPRFFEYKPNLRPRNFKQIVDNEEEIKKKEQRRYRNGYGRMRVKNWHQTLEENTITDEKKEEVEIKEKTQFSEDDLSENNPESSDDENHDRKQCLQCLMSDVQQRFIGSSNNLCSHGSNEVGENTNLKRDLTLESKTVDNKNNINEGSANIGDLPGRRLPTILEENYGKCECRLAESRVIDNVEEENGKFCTGTMKRRPRTAEDYLVDSSEKPFFNVIKQRINSRSKTLEDLDSFRNEIFTKKPDTEHTCIHRFTIDERLFPKPLHCDESGTSCCIQCDKPMKSSEKSVFLDQRESKERVGDETKVQRQVSKFSLTPKPVHIGAKNSVMEIRLGPEHDELLKGYDSETVRKKEFYSDSLALRHQRR